MADYLVNLYDMDPSWSPEKLEEAGITIRRVLSPDKGGVLPQAVLADEGVDVLVGGMLEVVLRLVALDHMAVL